MSSAANGHAPESRALTEAESIEIRRAIGRLQNGAKELRVVVLVVPIFLAGAELAAEGLNGAGYILRDGMQKPFDRALFVAFFVTLLLLLVRAELVSRRIVSLMADALSDDSARRAGARARIQSLGGPRIVRHAGEWLHRRWSRVLGGLVAALVAVNLLAHTLNPIWLVVFGTVSVAMDIRWRAMVADIVDQFP